MTQKAPATLKARIDRARQKLSRLKAQLRLRNARSNAKMKTLQRRAEYRRRLNLGGAVLAAGVGDWEADELLGLLLDGRDRALGSKTARLAMRKRGQAVLAPQPEDARSVAAAPASSIPLDLPKESVEP